VASLCLLVVAACSGGAGKRLIPPPPDTVAKLTTAPPGSDFSGVPLNPVEGRPVADKVAITGGDASLSGLITGPEGPVAGATVRVERFVGDAIAHLDVISNGDGTWRAPQPNAPTTIPPDTQVTVPGQLPVLPQTTTLPPAPVTSAVGPQGILGGRYRVRAWRAPDLALTAPQILFLEGKQNRQLGLQLARYGGTAASAISSPDPPVVDAITNVTAVVTSLSVDGDGVVRSLPLAGAAVELTAGGAWLLMGGPTVTNAQGRATFQLRCQALGQSPLDLTVNGGQSFSLPIRACVPPAPTTSSSLLDPFATTTSSSSIPGGRPTSSTRFTPST
jgi:hypothetical protein